MLIAHPDLPGQSAEVTELQFELLWKQRGWVPDEPPVDLDGKSVQTLLHEIDGDPHKAAVVLAHERAHGSPRKTLVDALEPLVAQLTADQGDAQTKES